MNSIFLETYTMSNLRPLNSIRKPLPYKRTSFLVITFSKIAALLEFLFKNTSTPIKLKPSSRKSLPKLSPKKSKPLSIKNNPTPHHPTSRKYLPTKTREPLHWITLKTTSQHQHWTKSKETNSPPNNRETEKNFTSKCSKKNKKVWPRNYSAGKKNLKKPKITLTESLIKTKQWVDSLQAGINWSRTWKVSSKTKNFHWKRKIKKSIALLITLGTRSERQERRESTR